MSSATARLGRIGEELAARHLVALGLVVVDRNWRPRGAGVRGEIDLVARRPGLVVVCEVKTLRRPTAAGPLELITAAKVRQLRRLAALWRSAHPDAAGLLRLDGIGVSWPRGGGRPLIEHIDGLDG